MLIRRIEVKNFRRLIGPVVINGLKEGINVIAGDNEEGKSTLLQALKAAFFQRHTSTSVHVKQFLPYNSVVRPEVTVDFDWNGKKYSIQKGFCTKPHLAEFISPTGKFQGAEAEEQIRELFKLPAAEKGKKAAELDAGIWGLLWLEQGKATDGLKTEESGKEALLKALESDLSLVLGGQSGRALLKKIESQYRDCFTPTTGKEKGDYKKSKERQLELSQQLADCQQKYDQYKKKLIELADKQDALAKHQRDKSLEKAKGDIEQAAQELQLAERLQLEEQAAKQTQLAAELDYKGKKEKYDLRKELSKRRESLQKQLLENEAAITTAEAKVAQCKIATENSKTKHASTESDLQAAESKCQQAEKRDQIIKLQQSRAEVEKQIKSVEDLQRELNSLTSEIDKISIDQPGIDNLRKLEAQQKEAEIRADTAATRVTVRPLASKEASIDKKKLISGEEVSLTQKTTINLEEWGEIDITPGDEGTQSYAQTAATTAQQLMTALSKTGVATVQEAQELLDKRKEYVNNIEPTKKQIATICGADGLEELQKKLKKIDADIQSQDVSTNAKSAMQEELTDLRTLRESARELEKQAKNAYEQTREILDKAAVELATISSSKESTAASLGEVEKQLNEHNKDDIAAQELAVKQAEEKYLSAQNATMLKSLEVGKLNIDEIKKKHEACKAVCSKLETEIGNLKSDISGLIAGIDAHGQQGLGEELERLDGEVELAQKEFKRFERKANALKLLYETLSDAEQEAKQQFLEPVITKLNPYLQMVFPGANLILDNQAVEISHLQRNGVDEDYFNLSVGTREQLSVLTRLSIASLMQEKGQPSVVVLDDALVYSDDNRIAKMKEVLKQVSAHTQVLVLTCRRRDYEDMESANFIEFQSQAKMTIKV